MIESIKLFNKLSPLTFQIIHHPLYADIASLGHLRIFMEQHVFAVWDFMCLLKELHRHLVSTGAPWLPPKDALSAHLIGNILAEEEGDLDEEGNYSSHYDIYLRAMEKIGASTASIKQLHALLMNGSSIEEALNQPSIREKTQQFVLTTFSFFNQEAHEIAAAFVYGREGITTSMFSPVIEKIEAETQGKLPEELSTLMYYLKRHVQLDGEEHFPKALQMMESLMENNPKKIQEAEVSASKALKARIEFLDDIHRSFLEQAPVLTAKNFLGGNTAHTISSGVT
jgi:hypothetical protein